MTTYKMLKLLISKNRYTYEDMAHKLDLFFAMGRISEEEYIELTGLLTKPDEDANGEV